MARHHPDPLVISFDDSRKALGLRHGENEGAAAHFAIARAKSLLSEKQPFVWNSTHLSDSGQQRVMASGSPARAVN